MELVKNLSWTVNHQIVLKDLLFVLTVPVFLINVVHQSHAQPMPDTSVMIIHVNLTQEIVHNIDYALLIYQFSVQTVLVFQTEWNVMPKQVVLLKNQSNAQIFLVLKKSKIVIPLVVVHLVQSNVLADNVLQQFLNVQSRNAHRLLL